MWVALLIVGVLLAALLVWAITRDKLICPLCKHPMSRHVPINTGHAVNGAYHSSSATAIASSGHQRRIPGHYWRLIATNSSRPPPSASIASTKPIPRAKYLCSLMPSSKGDESRIFRQVGNVP